MAKSIDGQKHPIMQTLKDIQTEKGREETGAFHVENPMLVGRALNYAHGVRFVVCTDRFLSSEDAPKVAEAAKTAGVELYRVTEGLMAKIIPSKPAPGVVACVERRICDPTDLLEGENRLIMLIDRCENPDNLGMLLRSLDAAGVDGVALTSDGCDPCNRLCVRASRGSVLSLNIGVVAEPENWIIVAKSRGFRVIASSAHGADNFWKADFTGRVILVVGNEHTGVRQSIRDIADSFIYVPMVGKMESLNIAVAGAIIAYEAVRQRSST